LASPDGAADPPPARFERTAHVTFALQSGPLSIAYHAMRFWIVCGISVSIAVSAFAQTIDVAGKKGGKAGPKKPSPAASAKPQASQTPAENPAYRPILLGKGPNALINRIDTAALLKGGQKDGLVMFTCSVDKTGRMVVTAVYRASPNSDLLQQELKRRLIDATFVPGVYEHQPVDAVYYGTVSFVVVEGKPRLRIFSNQEYPELKAESDFIGPQPIVGGVSGFVGLRYPPAAAAQVPVAGIADIKLKIDEQGIIQSMAVAGEHPPLIGFGAQALMDLYGTKFIPAFREGKPVACEITLPLYYPAP